MRFVFHGGALVCVGGLSETPFQLCHNLEVPLRWSSAKDTTGFIDRIGRVERVETEHGSDSGSLQLLDKYSLFVNSRSRS